MRARASTSGLNCGWTVTSGTRSPLTQTSRPSRSDSRYSSPVRITCATCSWRDRRARRQLLGDAADAATAVGEQIAGDAYDLPVGEQLPQQREAGLVVRLVEQRCDDAAVDGVVVGVRHDEALAVDLGVREHGHLHDLEL